MEECRVGKGRFASGHRSHRLVGWDICPLWEGRLGTFLSQPPFIYFITFFTGLVVRAADNPTHPHSHICRPHAPRSVKQLLRNLSHNHACRDKGFDRRGTDTNSLALQLTEPNSIVSNLILRVLK
jgi:hypothetical protein